jgi:thiol-disulfide isomerase/thioredoxin
MDQFPNLAALFILMCLLSACTQAVAVQPYLLELDATEMPPLVTGSPPLTVVSGKLHASDLSDFKMASGDLQFVEFYAQWCVVCKRFAPMIHGLEKEYEGRVNFVYADVQHPDSFDLRYALPNPGVPSYVLLNGDGEVLANWVGPVSRQDLRSTFDEALN